MNVSLLFEAFCDRLYTAESHLQSREITGAVHTNIDTIVEQARQLIVEQTVTTSTEKTLRIAADSLCIHGDNELALASVKGIRNLLISL